ncbi:hypothetical protein FITA111629_04965 [Filibacter tadaridae]|uniref:Uncharacterized protein n=1 Tax=Filibacter tadaridae TaxID=2483811 RepID=A0A3P5XCM1_9BACL|nr:hypothetical protein [Filibacter tadaridae]VDC32411.1 hypothetical protein FILTAD_02639 [Filibacter tadaridae]
MNKTTVAWTAIVGALLMAVGLKFLHVFKFINWSPVGWSKKWKVFESAHFSVKWALLILALMIIIALLYVALSFTYSIPPSITSIIAGIIIVFIVEWSIGSPETPGAALKSISIPFFVMIAITCRFVVGTAVFMKKLSIESIK